jgi:hypothetical protein
MKIKYVLSEILEHLEEFKPETLSGIVDFVKNHNQYNTIVMLIRNGSKSRQYFLDQCSSLRENNNPFSDVQLAGLLVILAEINTELATDWASRISKGSGNYKWSSAMAASYLIQKEVVDETVCKSA